LPLFPLLLLQLTPGALAHRPHAVIVGAAMDPAGPDWALLDREGIVGLLRSDDDGAHWDFAGGPPVSEVLVDIELLADGTLAAVSAEGGLWWTDGPGGAWARQDLGVTPTALETDGERLAVSASEGALLGTPGADFVRLGESRAAVRAVAFEPDGALLLVMESGSIRRARVDEGGVLSNEGLTRLPDDVSAWSVTTWGGDVIAGTDQELFALRDGAWSPCGALPLSVDDQYARVVPLVVSDAQRLMAATGREALFVSEDGCATWTFLDTQQRPTYDGLGLAKSPDEAFTRVYWSGDRLIVAGFNGIARSDDGGGDFREVVVIPADSVRGVSFAGDWPSDPRLWFGGYGGGSWWTDDGGNTWSGSAVGLTGEGPYGNALYSYDITADGYDAVYVGALIPYRFDGGRWQPLDSPMTFTSDFEVERGLLLAFGGEDGRQYGTVAASSDGGESWSVMDDLNALVGGGAGLSGLTWTALEDESGWLLTAINSTETWFSPDGEAWEPLLDDRGGMSIGGATWPPGEGRRVVVMAREGVAWLSDDRGASWRDVPLDVTGELRGFVAADDGALFAMDRSGQLHRSEDGAETWEAVGAPLPAPLNALVAAPDFDRTGALLAGTWEGTWWSGDRGETWRRLPRYLRAEAVSVHLRCRRPGDGEVWCERYQDDEQGFGGGWLLAPDDRSRFSFPGTAITLLGAEAGDDASVTIDGEVHAFSGAGPYTVADLAPGWHDVDIITDGVLHLDAYEVVGEGEPMLTRSEPELGCGCTHRPRSPLSSIAVLAVLAFVIRRRGAHGA